MFLCLSFVVGCAVSLSGQQAAPAPRIPNQNPNGMHVYLQAGLKTHQAGQHDYPQFLADWSKILTEHGAIVDGSLHHPSAAELEHTDVLVIYKGDDGYMSEDMLKLNLWTPSLTGKRPVMVYFHGGGFTFGSSYELPSQEGAQMARHHDVVHISVNHRLNVLGFLDLSAVGGDGAVGLGDPEPQAGIGDSGSAGAR